MPVSSNQTAIGTLTAPRRAATWWVVPQRPMRRSSQVRPWLRLAGENVQRHGGDGEAKS
jgi:hypothetical protein